MGQFREGDKLIDIVLRQPIDERNAITDIRNANLPTASGKSVRLTQIAAMYAAWFRVRRAPDPPANAAIGPALPVPG